MTRQGTSLENISPGDLFMPIHGKKRGELLRFGLCISVETWTNEADEECRFVRWLFDMRLYEFTGKNDMFVWVP